MPAWSSSSRVRDLPTRAYTPGPDTTAPVSSSDRGASPTGAELIGRQLVAPLGGSQDRARAGRPDPARRWDDAPGEGGET